MPSHVVLVSTLFILTLMVELSEPSMISVTFAISLLLTFKGPLFLRNTQIVIFTFNPPVSGIWSRTAAIIAFSCHFQSVLEYLFNDDFNAFRRASFHSVFRESTVNIYDELRYTSDYSRRRSQRKPQREKERIFFFKT